MAASTPRSSRKGDTRLEPEARLATGIAFRRRDTLLFQDDDETIEVSDRPPP